MPSVRHHSGQTSANACEVGRNSGRLARSKLPVASATVGSSSIAPACCRSAGKERGWNRVKNGIGPACRPARSTRRPDAEIRPSRASARRSGGGKIAGTAVWVARQAVRLKANMPAQAAAAIAGIFHDVSVMSAGENDENHYSNIAKN